jgi:formylglycine-generating enzyme required for sulfatase activity
LQPRRKIPWLPLGVGLTIALASVLAYFKFQRKTPPPRPSVRNSLGMTFVEIPAGKFLMGSPPGERDRQDDETQHEVEITRPFYLGATEVTQGQYQQVMGTNPSVLPSLSESQRAEYAVENVSWDEAVEFCRRLSQLPEEKAAGRTYRLPTEAEWEYACRAGGEEEGNLAEHGWYDGNSHRKGIPERIPELHPVGSLKKNGWDLYDMRGGVWEWCSDWYERDYHKHSAPRDPQGPDMGAFRVARGGSWADPASDCRCARRLALAPGVRLGMGFRVVLVQGSKR